jgi:hypothetical protein
LNCVRLEIGAGEQNTPLLEFFKPLYILRAVYPDTETKTMATKKVAKKKTKKKAAKKKR